jgi:hypothetical protein
LSSIADEDDAMKRTGAFLMLATILWLPQWSLGAPTMTPYEDGVEGGKVLDLTVNATGNGVATIGRQCRGCGPLHLTVTPLSRVIVGGRPLPITPETKLKGKTGDVYYVIEGKKLTRIRLY